MIERKMRIWIIVLTVLLLSLITACGTESEDVASVSQTTKAIEETTTENTLTAASSELENADDGFIIPEYTGEPSVSVNNNVPQFD